ncbi:MAG: PIN domain-containing protein [Candidatus Bathyarchaeia archaeon]
MTLKVILDSNFLFIPSQFQLDIFEELLNLLNQQFDPILLSVTRQELLTMAKKGSPKMRKQASLALKLAQKCRVVQVKQGMNESHDDVVVRIAQKWKCSIATNDQTLRKRLRSKGITVIFLRGKNRLALEGAL